MGARYADPVILDLEKTWEEGDIRTPLICFLSMGSDPTNQIEGLGKKLKVGKYFIQFKTHSRVPQRQWTLLLITQNNYKRKTLLGNKSKIKHLKATRAFFLSLLSCNFDDQFSSNFDRFVILCIC